MNYNKDEDVAFRFNIILLSTSKSTNQPLQIKLIRKNMYINVKVYNIFIIVVFGRKKLIKLNVDYIFLSKL